MKTMKAMKKAMKVSKIAKGRLAKVLVFRGTKAKTVGGLKKDSLVKNKHGKVVSKKRAANAKKGKLAAWAGAVVKARKARGIKGFCAVGGAKPQGKALLAKARS